MKKLTIGILAHVDSGKTTLSEAMLYESGVIRSLGRVDHQNSFLDTDPLERSRGITIFSKQAQLEFLNSEITLLDTPGHVDFAAETERCFQVLDYAILVISGSEGVQNHTETLWRLLRDRNIPTFIFVNKMDLSIKKQREMMAHIQEKLGDACTDFTPYRISEDFLDDLTFRSEAIMEFALENDKSKADEEIKALAASEIKACKLFPTLFGSALKLQGVNEFLKVIDEYALPTDVRENFAARIFKISRDNQGARLTFMKITGGRIALREMLSGVNAEGEEWEEKLVQLRKYSGDKYKNVEAAEQGDIVAAVGLSKTMIGDVLGDEVKLHEEVLEPFLDYIVIPEKGTDIQRATIDMKTLAEEDPKLHTSWNDETKELHVSLMGHIQLDVLKEVVKKRFGYEISFGKGRIVYKERIAGIAEGIGHFDPIRHYAEVHLIMEPGEPGSGVVCSSICNEDLLDKNWQRLIFQHLCERTHRGVLTCSALTDTKIMLASGRASKKHTVGGDFRQATYRAVRNGLMKAGCVLMEPWFDFELSLPTENVGRAMNDIIKMGGTIEEPLTENGRSTIYGSCPVSEMIDYQSEVITYTKGLGRLSMRLSGYRDCHNTEEVVARIGYDPEHDTRNTGDSVFFLHGNTEIIPWYEIEDYMNLPSALDERNVDSELGYIAPIVPNGAKVHGNYMSASNDELNAIFERTYGLNKASRQAGHPKKKSAYTIRAEEKPYVGKERKNGSKSKGTYLFVDGYNVIYSWTELKEISKRDYGAARDQLIEVLRNYQGYTGEKIIVVFDAYKVKSGKGSSGTLGNIEIVYTKENQTADTYIEKATAEVPKDYQIKVVSSDAQIQQISLGHGAVRISAPEFKKNVEEISEAIRKRIR